MKIPQIVNYFKNDDVLRKNIVLHKVTPKVEPIYSDFPQNISQEIIGILHKKNINNLYCHQAKAISSILQKQNVIISTGVASGKSMCYQIPILNELIADTKTRALLLFPTKALTQDQHKSMSSWFTESGELHQSLAKTKVGIYDGDTSAKNKIAIKKTANIVFTNPDMLHLGILPHHAKWKDFFQNLKYIVVDEVHMYRGIFGSHFANLIRRIKRICDFYGSKPLFVVTSATISNTKYFVEKLFEEKFIDVNKDGAPKSEKHFIIYNPPITNHDLGLRRNSLLETVSIYQFLARFNLQTLIFNRSRKNVELILSYIKIKGNEDKIYGYRSGYLASERREIEQKLKKQEISTVVSTNALELGIDIGGLDLILINGYPGNISSTLQQAGRAGRKSKPSITILIMTASLIDQYIVQNPEFLLSKNPEQALINPDNPYILLQHIQCAVFEKPFENNEPFGQITSTNKYLQILQSKKKIIKMKSSYFWRSKDYPASSVSFRGTGANNFTLICNDKVIGIIDRNSAFWFAHPQAIYIHNGLSYLVISLNITQNEIHLIEKKTDYYTQSNKETEFTLLEKYQENHFENHTAYYGFLKVISQVTSYKKKQYHTNEILDYGDVDLPPTSLATTGFWFSLSEKLINVLEKKKRWKSKNNYGKDWKKISQEVKERDNNCCQNCGKEDQNLDVHHKIPFKQFENKNDANRLDNLVTLCKSCHKKVEVNVYIQSSLAGLKYLLRNLAPVYLMCDKNDIRVEFEETCEIGEKKPTLIFYDSVPGGIGLSKKISELYQKLFAHGIEIISHCECKSGCPSCVGPVAENGVGAKAKALELLIELKKELPK
ncbi:MAG: DEAD/DEAH box helicase [Candidatus Cloacimonadota bacterium]|nr:DEAD/DEAH box helicase [Candidatus Cloacimonadota bacterium]